ncbi:MAG: HAMP domain-containing histidine kinase [Saccharofermentans sp.]|nr:HAMP domain-containing histidine kinase [Saccharofermentans sp.]
MKRRKTIKKPNFLKQYLGSLIIVAAILITIGVIVCAGAANSYSKDVSLYRTNAGNMVEYAGNESLFNEKIARSDVTYLKKAVLDNYSSNGQRYKIYFDQKLIADTSKNAIVTYAAIDDYVNLEIADKKYLEYFNTPEILKHQAYPETFSAYERILHRNNVISFALKEAYIDRTNCKFIPAVAEIIDWKRIEKTNEQTDQIAIESVPVRTGIIVDFHIEKDSVPAGYTYLKCYYDEGIGKVSGFEGVDDDHDYAVVSDGFNTHDVSFCIKRTRMETNSFDEAYRKEIMTAICLIVLASLAAALVPAMITYNTKKRNYEIFEYRRKMTDAMAHDLKTPMAAILSYAENFENNTGSDKREFYVSKISEKVWQMNKMVNNMLDFSRGENTSVVVKKTPVDIGAVIADAIASNEHEITRRGLTVEFDQKEVTVDTDKELFAQAIGNLINNAALYAKKGTEISVTCESGKIVISNVSAAPVEDAEALKQPFAKGDESRRNYGSGLGLAIAENNLVLLSYKLDVKSEGDRFVVTVTL